MVIQAVLQVAVQLQPMPAVRLTLPLLALDATDALEEEMEYVQRAVAWLTAKVWPAIVIVPVRSAVLLAATE